MLPPSVCIYYHSPKKELRPFDKQRAKACRQGQAQHSPTFLLVYSHVTNRARPWLGSKTSHQVRLYSPSMAVASPMNLSASEQAAMTSIRVNNAPRGVLLCGERHEESPRLSTSSGRLVESVALLPSPGPSRLVWVYVTRGLSALRCTPTERRIRKHVVHHSMDKQAALAALPLEHADQSGLAHGGCAASRWTLVSRAGKLAACLLSKGL